MADKYFSTPNPDTQVNKTSTRLLEIAKSIQGNIARRDEIERTIRALEQEKSDLWTADYALRDEAWKLAPDVAGERYPVPNDMPRDFSICEIGAFASFYATMGMWNAIVEDVYDGCVGASDPQYVGDGGYTTAEAALVVANAKAREIAERLNKATQQPAAAPDASESEVES